jgi:hypothetical protein
MEHGAWSMEHGAWSMVFTHCPCCNVVQDCSLLLLVGVPVYMNSMLLQDFGGIKNAITCHGEPEHATACPVPQHALPHTRLARHPSTPPSPPRLLLAERLRALPHEDVAELRRLRDARGRALASREHRGTLRVRGRGRRRASLSCICQEAPGPLAYVHQHVADWGMNKLLHCRHQKRKCV